MTSEKPASAAPVVRPATFDRGIIPLSAACEFGGGAFRFILPLIALQRTADPLVLGTVRASILLPSALFGLFIGAAFDTFHVTRTLRAALVVAAVFCVLLGLGLAAGDVQLPLLIGGCVCVAFCSYAASVGVNVVVRHRAELGAVPRTMGHLATTARVVGLATPLLAGTLVGMNAPLPAMILVAAAFALGAWLIPPIAPSRSETTRLRDRIPAAWGFVTRSRSLLMLCAAAALCNLAIAMFEIGYLILMLQTHHLGAQGIGAIGALAALVGICAGFAAPRHMRALGPQRTLLAATAVLCAGCAALAAGPSVPVIVLACLVLTFASVLFNVALYSVRQATTPKILIGGVVGLTGSFFKILMPAAALCAGWLILRGGTPVAFGMAAVCMAASFLAVLCAGGELNSADEAQAAA